MYEKPYVDKAIVRLHTTISYNILFYMYDKVILYYIVCVCYTCLSLKGTI